MYFDKDTGVFVERTDDDGLYTTKSTAGPDGGVSEKQEGLLRDAADPSVCQKSIRECKHQCCYAAVGQVISGNPC